MWYQRKDKILQFLAIQVILIYDYWSKGKTWPNIVGFEFLFQYQQIKIDLLLKVCFFSFFINLSKKKLLHTISLPIIFSVSMKKKRKSLWNYNFYINELWSFCKIWLSVGNHKNSIFLFIWLKSYLTIIKTSNHRNTIIDSQLGLTLNVILISGLKRNKFIFLYVGNQVYFYSVAFTISPK